MSKTIKSGTVEKWCGYTSVIHLTSSWQPRKMEVRPGIIYMIESGNVKSSIPLNAATKIKNNAEQAQITFEFQKKCIIIRTDPFQYASWSEAIYKGTMTIEDEMQKISALSEKLDVDDSDSEQETRPIKILAQLHDVHRQDFINGLKRIYQVFESMLERTELERKKKNTKTSFIVDYYKFIKQGMYYIIDDRTKFNTYDRSVNAQIRNAYTQHDSSMHAVKMLNKELYNSKFIQETLEVFLKGCKCQHLCEERLEGLKLISTKRSESDEFFDAESSVDNDEIIELNETKVSQSVPEDIHKKEIDIDVSQENTPSSFVRRRRLPRPRTDFKVSLWSLLKDTIGRDLSRIALPVTFNEPTSFLQRSAEDFMYTGLLDMAAKCDGPLKEFNLPENMTTAGYIAAFMASPFASAAGRTFKPFNPLLGETYELTHRGFKYVSEQVTHHPPALAYHCTDDNGLWIAEGDLTVNTSFTGKSLSVAMRGNYEIKINGYVYRGTRPMMTVDNVIFGKLNVDLMGQSLLACPENQTYVVIEYMRGSWWRYDDYNVKAVVYGSNGCPQLYLYGDWKENLFASKLRLDRGAKPLPYITHKTIAEGKRGIYIPIDWELFKNNVSPSVCVWQSIPRPDNASIYYEFSEMSFELNEISPEYNPNITPIPPTDSRFRPDQRLLERGYAQDSNNEKRRLEEKQRAVARERANGESEWNPVWFNKSNKVHSFSGQPHFPYKDNYWQFKELVTNKEADYTSVCPDIFSNDDSHINKSHSKTID